LASKIWGLGVTPSSYMESEHVLSGSLTVQVFFPKRFFPNTYKA